MDLSIEIAGMHFANPLLPAAGPLTGDDKKMKYIASLGIGGMVTKTISTEGAKVPRPCIVATKDYVVNAELWSEYGPDRWIDEFLPGIQSLKMPKIVSIGYSKSQIEYLVPRLKDFGDAFEISTHYTGKDIAPIIEIAKTAIKLSKKPVFMKVSPHMPDPVEFAQSMKDVGVAGIVAVNSFGPVYYVDPKFGHPTLGSENRYGWISGPIIKPIALSIVLRIKQSVDIPVIGVGGVRTSDDLVDFLEVGASAVGMLSSALIYGKEQYRRIVSGLEVALKKRGYASVKDAIASKIEKKPAEFTVRNPQIDTAKCTLCKMCEYVCPYFAITVTDHVEVDTNACFGCGLCQTRCPVDAISGVLK
ncbi:4Fe-4S binding protein [Athalassotoga sp.]|uniref:4Fe-4S binding protein n=1 Tax=Athalassotoga sp. TaxID=2022597 RepID=UPI003D00AE36